MFKLPQTPRHIYLSGAPAPLSLKSVFKHSSEIGMLGALSVGFGLVALPSGGSVLPIAAAVAQEIALYTVTLGVIHGIAESAYGMRGKIIDKQPAALPSMKERSFAAQMQQVAGYGIFYGSCLLAFNSFGHAKDIANAMAGSAPLATAAVANITGPAVFAGSCALRWARFREVVKGNWAFADKPKRVRKPKEEKAPDLSLGNPA